MPGAYDSFLTALRAHATGVTKVNIGNVTVERFRLDGLLTYAWQRYAAFVTVGGPDATSVDTVVHSLILGNVQRV